MGHPTFRTARYPYYCTALSLPLHATGKSSAFRERFKGAGWTGIWTDTIYDYTHFHSNAHEVLGIAEGKVTLWLGGDRGSLFRLKAGDMLVIPAGVGPRRLGGDDGLKVIGAYPRGQSHYDMKRRGRAIPSVDRPSADPFYGANGPPYKGVAGSKCDSRNVEAEYAQSVAAFMP